MYCKYKGGKHVLDIKGKKYLPQNERRDEPTEESDWPPRSSCTKMVRRDTVVDASTRIGMTSSSQSVRPGTVTGTKLLLSHKLGSVILDSITWIQVSVPTLLAPPQQNEYFVGGGV